MSMVDGGEGRILSNWGVGPRGAHARSFIFRRISSKKARKCSAFCEVFSMRDEAVSGRKRGGRPEHNASQRTRNRVTRMTAFGWTNERIAGVLGVTLPTLKKHYRAELKL